MNRHRTALRVLLVAALACLLTGSLLAPARAADDDDGTVKPGQRKAATIGIRTASAKAGDDRGVFSYEVLPRGVVRDWVAVANFRQQPVTVQLYARDAGTAPGTPFAVQSAATKPNDLGAWIALEKNRVTIPARREVIVPFQLGVPHNAVPGDHSAAIVVSLTTKEAAPKGGTVSVENRVGMRVHLRVPGDLKPALKVEELNVDWDGESDLMGRGDATITYLVRNTGNLRLNVSGSVELTRILGLPALAASAPAVEDLLPGGTTAVTQVVENVFGTGPMKASVSLRGVPQDPALKSKVVTVTELKGFPAWSLLLIAVVAGLLLLIAGGGWFERRRRKARDERTAELAVQEEEVRANAKHRLLVRGALAVLTPVLALGAVLAPVLVAPAQAAETDQWQASISKKQGIGTEPFDINTSGACPLPATNIVGFGYGAGFPKTGAVVVSNTGPVSNESGFRAALVDSMKNIMALQPDPRGLSGTYKFVIRCIVPEFPDKSYGEYIASIRFDKPDHWVALGPLTTKKGPLADASTRNGEPKTSLGATPNTTPGTAPGATPGPGTNASPGGPQAGDAAGDEASQRAEELLGADTSDSDASGSNTLLLGAGVAVLIGSLLLAFGRRIPGSWRRS